MIRDADVSTQPMRPATVVMAKLPRPGFGKTRLTPFLSAIDAASLAAALLTDALQRARAVTSDVILAYDVVAGTPDAQVDANLYAASLRIPQHGATLGDRIANAAAHAAKLGFDPLLITGTDSPTLPLEHLRHTLSVLTESRAEIALGATEDGGYHLIGLRASLADSLAGGLFDKVVWSTAHVYEQTAFNARKSGLRVYDAAPWYDVDTPADLRRLYEELANDSDARHRAQATARWCDDHASLFGNGLSSAMV